MNKPTQLEMLSKHGLSMTVGEVLDIIKVLEYNGFSESFESHWSMSDLVGHCIFDLETTND